MGRLLLFVIIGIISIIIAVIKSAVGHAIGNEKLKNTTLKGETKKVMDKTAKGIGWMAQQWEESKLKATVHEDSPLLPAAQGEDAITQFNLGSYHLKAQNYTEAVACLRKAAEQGHAEAQGALGYAYAQGCGVTQNYTEAAKWMRKAADQGFAAAQYELSVYYYHGYGVPHDFTEAVKWCRKAAEQGNADAQSNLARIL